MVWSNGQERDDIHESLIKEDKMAGSGAGKGYERSACQGAGTRCASLGFERGENACPVMVKITSLGLTTCVRIASNPTRSHIAV